MNQRIGNAGLAFALLAAFACGSIVPNDDDVERDADADEQSGEIDVPDDGAPGGDADGDDGEVDGDARDDGDADGDADGDEGDGGVEGDGEVGDGDGDDGGDDGEITPVCPNGVTEPPEECDDGNTVPGDGCEPDCTFTCTLDEHCDDSVFCNGPEACSGHVCAGGTPPADLTACTTDTGNPGVCRGGLCAPIECGNSLRDPDEECDDGNTDNTDACLNDCRDATCGDGWVWADHEDCDGVPSRSCDTSCGSTGVELCVACGWTGVCSPPDEICNGLDDDCVGGADDGFSCVQGGTTSCATTCGSIGTGTCSGTCEVPPAGDCTPPIEVCNGADDDCANGADDGFTCVMGSPVSCDTSCSTVGTGTCTLSCAIPLPAACTAPAETCNGIDDDCVGGADDGFDCALGTTQGCTARTCPGTQSCQAGSCTWGACTLGAGPGNDACGGTPIEIGTRALAVYTGTTCGAGDDFSGACGGSGGWDVIYRLTLSMRSDVILDTTGSGFDTVLVLLSGSACPGVEVACDDNGGAGGPPASQVSRTLDPGTWWVVVDGAGGTAAGDYALAVAITPTSSPPGNDGCSGAIDMGTGGTFSASTASATDDNTACSGAADGRDVWYRFTVPAATQWIVYLDTVDGQTWDSVIHVRPGSCGAFGADAACADDQCGGTRSQWVGILGAGTYYVAVDGASAAAAGSFTLLFQRSAMCGTSATRITGNGSYSGNTTGAGDDTRPSCRSGESVADTLYYLGLCATGSITVRTCDPGSASFDTVLSVRSGTCSSSDVACSDNPGGGGCSGGRSTITVSLDRGLHFVTVDGRDPGDVGAYVLDVTGF